MQFVEVLGFQGIAYFGTSYFYWFLEVCSGTAILTQAVRYVGLTALEPVDLLTGWDLTKQSCCLRLKARIREWRPLYTHFAPKCRIFSQAYRPRCPPEEYQERDDYKQTMCLALNIADLAAFCHRLKIFVSIEDPIASRIYNLPQYRYIHDNAGFFFVDAHMCMFVHVYQMRTKYEVRSTAYTMY